MARPSQSLTGHERSFGHDEIIVSKTDPRGIITYANDVFVRVSGYAEAELLGKPHCILRHPDMPRIVFKLLWDTISAGQEIFAYVLNRAKNGDHYWVFAHVTPTFDEHGGIVSYHSSRRSPDRNAVNTVKGVYAELLRIERRVQNPQEQMKLSLPAFQEFLRAQGKAYEELVFTL